MIPSCSPKQSEQNLCLHSLQVVSVGCARNGFSPLLFLIASSFVFSWLHFGHLGYIRWTPLLRSRRIFLFRSARKFWAISWSSGRAFDRKLTIASYTNWSFRSKDLSHGTKLSSSVDKRIHRHLRYQPDLSVTLCWYSFILPTRVPKGQKFIGVPAS